MMMMMMIIIIIITASNKCRLCLQLDETVQHTTYRQDQSNKERYIKGQDSVCSPTL